MVNERSNLKWCSPGEWQLGGSLYAIGASGVDVEQLAKELFEQRQIVVRPFTTLGLNALRVSPNLINTQEEMETLFDTIG